MLPENPFDELAQHYDTLFTNSETGRAQREIVRRFLKHRIVPGCKILEINCGTGEDAYYLASLGCTVLATDASQGMIQIAQGKREHNRDQSNPFFKQSSIQHLDLSIGTKKFDLIFSNFSGLNCLTEPELKQSAGRFHSMLNPNGKMIFVLFSTNCIWEKLYFFLKRNKNKRQRRNMNKYVEVQLLNSQMPVFYYKPDVLCKFFSPLFKMETLRPVGLFIPPTYLEPAFRRKKALFRVLKNMDRLSESWSFLSNWADHYLIEFSRV